jgi:hypothetical protein
MTSRGLYSISKRLKGSLTLFFGRVLFSFTSFPNENETEIKILKQEKVVL